MTGLGRICPEGIEASDDRVQSSLSLFNGLGTHGLPEPFNQSPPARRARQRQCKAGSGRFRHIRHIVCSQRMFA